jgi:hypothetical protein
LLAVYFMNCDFILLSVLIKEYFILRSLNSLKLFVELIECNFKLHGSISFSVYLVSSSIVDLTDSLHEGS